MTRHKAMLKCSLAVMVTFSLSLLGRPALGESATVSSTARKHVELGTIYALRNQLANAKTQFLLSLAIDKNNPGALNNLGNLMLLEDKLDSAITLYQAAAKISPEDGGINLNLGLLYYVLGADSSAIRELALALRKIGSPEQAGELMGISPTDSATHDSTTGSSDANRIRDLLKDAARSIPSPAVPSYPRPTLVSKRGGVKGSFGSANPEQLLYWKFETDTASHEEPPSHDSL